MEQTHNILFVDDEENILSSLTRLFRREGYGILTAPSGPQGLDILKEQKVSLIISDQRMPEMNGAKFLELSREIAPDAVRIMLTGHSEISAAMDAINNGEVYRFITKPWNDEEIKLTVREALKNYDLVAENKRLNELTLKQNEELRDLNQNLETKVQERTYEVRNLYAQLNESFFDAIWAFAGIVEVYDPFLGGHSKRVAAMSRAIAMEMGVEEKDVDIIEAAALLHDIGLIAVPRSILLKPANTLTKDEAAVMQQHPIIGQDMLKGVANLKPVGKLIRHHHERYNGKGYPDHLTGHDIPLGARIISLCDLFDELQNKRTSNKMIPADEIVRIFTADTQGFFDPEVLSVLRAQTEQDVREMREVREPAEVAVPIGGLRAGMKLAMPLLTVEGKLLISQNTVLTDIIIDHLRQFNRLGHIDGDAFVFKDKVQ